MFVRVPHCKRTIGLLTCRIPYLGLDYLTVIEGNQLTGKLDCDSWHDVVGNFISSEAIDDIGLACTYISN